MDEQYRKVTMGGAPQRRYRDRFFVNLNKQVGRAWRRQLLVRQWQVTRSIDVVWTH